MSPCCANPPPPPGARTSSLARRSTLQSSPSNSPLSIFRSAIWIRVPHFVVQQFADWAGQLLLMKHCLTFGLVGPSPCNEPAVHGRKNRHSDQREPRHLTGRGPAA